MKRAVGVNFGHDAAIAVVSENGIERFVSKERLSRCKNAYGWDFDTLAKELEKHTSDPIGISTAQDKFGPIAGAQGRFAVQSDDNKLSFQIGDLRIARSSRFSWLADLDLSNTACVMVREQWDSKVNRHGNLRYTSGLRNLNKLPDPALRDEAIDRYFDFRTTPHFGLSECRVRLDEKIIHGYFFMHHLSHATYAFWASGLDNALVLSHDGTASTGWAGGGYFWCSREFGVQPLIPGGFWMGHLYDTVATWVGVRDAGKLMGLAPYGTPKFFLDALVGSIGDVESRFGLEYVVLPAHWMRQLCGLLDPMVWATYERSLPQIAVDIAASAQKILEANIVANVETGLALTKFLGKPVDGIVMVGGTALNCPANTLVHQKFNMKVFVPPACSDEGHALGNAIGTYFRAYGSFPPTPRDPYESVYLGRQYSNAEVQEAVSGLERVGDFSASEVAKLLHSGAILGLFHGRSEVGPRALGHRSILASPLVLDNWAKVNAVKGREPWRPFAPICLEEDMDTYFAGSDMQSRFMLFTHVVKDGGLPAITHADKSARAQAATPSCGLVFDILKEFKARTGYGVLMNTSFNGKNVPIVETPQDAVTEARRIGLDYFVCEQGIFRVEN